MPLCYLIFTNHIQFTTAINLKWGEDDCGFSCRIDTPNSIAIANEYISDSETIEHIDIHLQGIIETLPSVGELHVSSPEKSKSYPVHFVTYKNQAHFTQQYNAILQRECGWNKHFEESDFTEEEIQHHLILSRASVGFQLRNPSS